MEVRYVLFIVFVFVELSTCPTLVSQSMFVRAESLCKLACNNVQTDFRGLLAGVHWPSL